MAWVKKNDAQRALGGLFRERAREAAGTNDLISRTEQKRLPAFLKRAADQVRAKKGKGARIDVDEVVDRAMTNAMKAWAKVNPPGHGLDSKYLSIKEAAQIDKADPALGRFTIIARERVAAAKDAEKAEGESTTGLPVQMTTDHPGATLVASGGAYRLTSNASGKPATLGFTPTATLSFSGKQLVLTANRNGHFSLHRMQAQMPGGYWLNVLNQQYGDPTVATFTIEKAVPNALTESQAVPLAQKALVDRIKGGRMKDGDWVHDLGAPSTWPELVADGIMTGVNAFGTGPNAQIIDEGRRITIVDDGPYALYSELTLDKVTREVVRAYIEID